MEKTNLPLNQPKESFQIIFSVSIEIAKISIHFVLTFDKYMYSSRKVEILEKKGLACTMYSSSHGLLLRALMAHYGPHVEEYYVHNSTIMG